MTRWGSTQLARVLPPQVSDTRGRAFLGSLDELLAREALGDLRVRRAMTCPTQALPALVAEYALDDFVEPGLPEAAVRRIVASAWMLQEARGYDLGVRLGLALLGMRAEISHWWQQEPQGKVGTNIITFMVGEALFDEDVRIGPRLIAAAHRMIDATKRWSQESTIRLGVNLHQGIGAAARAQVIALTRAEGEASRPAAFCSGCRFAPLTAQIQVFRPHASAGRRTIFGAPMRVGGGLRQLQIHRISATAA